MGHHIKTSKILYICVSDHKDFYKMKYCLKLMFFYEFLIRNFQLGLMTDEKVERKES